ERPGAVAGRARGHPRARPADHRAPEQGPAGRAAVRDPPGRGGPRGAPPRAPPWAPPELGQLITELQSRGLRVERPFETRRGGAGPADAGMIWVEGGAVTAPGGGGSCAGSPSVLRRG